MGLQKDVQHVVMGAIQSVSVCVCVCVCVCVHPSSNMSVGGIENVFLT